jgi:hypothetical protein
MSIPMTLEDAVAQLKAEQETAEWAKSVEQEAVGAVHFTGGMRLRNDWGLWTGSRLALNLHHRFGLTHADDMSGLILHCLHREMNGLPWEVEIEVDRYRVYWAKHGGMPPPPWEKA